MPMLVEEFGAQTDDPTVDQGAKYRAELNPLKVPKTEEGKGEQDADQTADAIVDGLEFVNVDLHPPGDLLDEKLIGLGRYVAVEEEGNAYARFASFFMAAQADASYSRSECFIGRCEVMRNDKLSVQSMDFAVSIIELVKFLKENLQMCEKAVDFLKRYVKDITRYIDAAQKSVEESKIINKKYKDNFEDLVKYWNDFKMKYYSKI